MNKWIQPSLASRADALRGQFKANLPFPHIVIEDFLHLEFCDALIAQFPKFDTRKALNEYGEVGGKAVFDKVRKLGPAYCQFDDIIQSSEFLNLISEITGIPDLIYDPEYVGGGTHENQHGQDLDPHLDFNYHPKSGLHRRLNLILFLNPTWQEAWGGLLELHSDPWLPSNKNEVKSIMPFSNRCVIFETSEHSWHGFKRIKGNLIRRSLAVYFYTKDRPKEDIAPEHSTIYVQRQLSAHIRPGHTLSQEDFDEIRELIVRRDHQLKYLYRRKQQRSLDYGENGEQVSDLRNQIEKIARSPSFRLGRALTWPLRKILRR